MTATSDFIDWAERPTPAPLAQRWVHRFVRSIQAILGGGWVIGGVLLWAMPGATASYDVALLKMGLTVILWMSGALMLYGALRPVPWEQVDIDLVRREVRVRGVGGTEDVQICRFSKLGRAEMTDGVIGLWGPDGTFWADVDVPDADVQRLLVSALRDAGKL
ncbi:MAG: hypothetical protein AAF222_15440 [Pseudomonadota bacterium]